MLKIKRCFPIILLICILLKTNISQAETDYFFKQISIQDGMSQSNVKCILCDYKGQIWVGTLSGLNRYDRQTIKQYESDSNDHFSLPNNEIVFCIEDSLYNIWVSTERGTAKYDREKDNFIPVETIDGEPVNAHAHLTTEGGILFAGHNKFFKYSYADNSIRDLPVNGPEKVNAYIKKLCLYDAHTLLVSTRRNGIWMYNTGTGFIRRCPFIPEKNIRALHVDATQTIWVAPYGKGLYGYNWVGKQIYHFSTENSELTNNIILDILEKDNELWLATDGGGINILNLKTKTIRSIEHTPGDEHSLPSNSFSCLYSDSEDNVWAGSIRSGLIGIKQVYLRTYKDAPMNIPYGLSEKAVSCLYEDKGRIIWIGTDGGGVNRFNPETRTFTHYPSTYGLKVISITNYSDTELLLSLYGKGIFLFNKQTGKTGQLLFRNQTENDQLFRRGMAVNIFRAANEKIYLFGTKVYEFNPASQIFTEVTFNIPTDNFFILQPFYSTPEETYLFCMFGIYVLKHKENKLYSLFLSNEEILHTNAACYSPDGTIWIGTTKGLYRLDTKTQEVKNIHTPLFKNINSLCSDPKGRIWVGAKSMLFAYLPEKNNFILFDSSDGVSVNEFISRANLTAQNGDIYMGGVSGMLHIRNNMSIPTYPDPVINLLDVELDGVPVGYKITSENDLISIPWDHSSLIIKIIAKEKDLLRKKVFRYWIEGLSDKYIETQDHSISLRSLPVRNYKIWVSVSQRDGNWSSPVKILTVEVTPPWWKTTWFFLLSILLITGSIVFFVQLIIKQKEDKLQLEMKEHEKKTYEDKVRFLINISHELRTPLTLIYAPLKRILGSDKIKDEETNNQLTTVYKQVSQMKNLINIVLNVRKMETGNDTVNYKVHPLPEWIRSVAEDFRQELDNKNIKLAYNFAPDIKDLTFDEAKSQIILSNLLMNALKYSEEDTLITLSVKKVENYIRISVSDQGIGLQNLDLSRLFTRFYQGNQKQDLSSSGIGLSYSRILAEQQGGRLNAMDNTDKGATFYLELPVKNQAGESESQTKPYLNDLLFTQEVSTPEIQNFMLDSYSVLIVEDQTDLRNWLKGICREYFKSVYTAEDGIQAIDITKRRLPDIIVSDIMMPRMDGFKLCKQIKGSIEISHIPVILLTARNDANSTTTGYKLGADSYISKPFDIDFLLIVIRNLLKNRETVKLKYKESLSFAIPQESTFSYADEQFIQKLNLLILDNLDNPELDVNFLITNMAMSRASLYSKMKAVLDIGLNDYINKFRMEKATQLLTQTELSIEEVSEQSGFGSQRYFSSLFKQTYGISPSKYRQEKRK